MQAAPLLGRERELDRLLAGLDQLHAGQGGVWFVCGEPGIGKTRLVETVADLAARRGAAVLWGRAWEAGGAPAYWPWIQVLRGLLAGEDGPALLDAVPAARLAPLAALLPELAPRFELKKESSSLPPEHARFAVLDAASALLFAAARGRPRLIVLEDLHAADVATLELLDFASLETRTAALAVLGTYRDVDAARAPSGPALARISGRAQTLALRRLPPPEVARQLELAIGMPSSPDLASAVFAATEGNPLFVAETARLIAARGAEPGRVAIPNSVRAAIRERLAKLAPDTRRVLDVAAVIGREFRHATLARASQHANEAPARALADAGEANVLEELAPGQYRFAHILFREVLYQDLARETRERLHLALARALESEREAHASAAEIAHHYFEAGPEGREPASATAVRAAEQAQAQFAFGEAARLYQLAFEALERTNEPDAARVAELLLGLGRAQILAGEQARGNASCARAAEHARAAGDDVLFARAALSLGSVFVVGKVDPALVALLREALERLGAREPSLRARVMARLAAAEQPAPEPGTPIALARKAIALAREQGDPAVLLDVIRAGCSAMMDLGDPAERLALNREYVALASELGERAEMLRGTLRLCFDCFELGEVREARAAIDRAERIAHELGHPHYAWRVAAMQAMRAAFAGEFAEAERALERAAELGERAFDPNAERGLLLQRLGLLRQQGRLDELLALLPAARRVFKGESYTLAFVEALALSARARVDEPAAVYDLSLAEFAISTQDHALLEIAAEICRAAGAAELAEQTLERVRHVASGFVHGGMFGLTWEGPYSRVLALLHATCGRFEQAQRCFGDALGRVQEAGARAHHAWLAYEYARFLRSHGDDARAGELLARAGQLAAELGMPALEAAVARAGGGAARAVAEAADAARAQPGGAAVPRVRYFSMARDGELWRIDCDGASFHLKDGKGLRMLAELVREPGRELHALELSEPQGALDTGDAGAVLDARARAEYRARIESLRAEIEEAERDQDLGRVERKREELELLGRELARAVGLGGRERKSGAAAERARVNVQRRLRDAIRRIGEHHPELGRHLEWAVRTGTFCSYEPR